jgi:hypothetical protein
VATVPNGRFCSLEKPRSMTQTILTRVQSRISSLTWRISAWSEAFPGQHQQRTGIPSLVTAMPMTICGRSSRELSDLP